MIERSCERCGCGFVSNIPHARFCSAQCRKRARDSRREQRERAERLANPIYVAFKLANETARKLAYDEAQGRRERRVQQREQREADERLKRAAKQAVSDQRKRERDSRKKNRGK